jgi:hypothetical protein
MKLGLGERRSLRELGYASWYAPVQRDVLRIPSKEVSPAHAGYQWARLRLVDPTGARTNRLYRFKEFLRGALGDSDDVAPW